LRPRRAAPQHFAPGIPWWFFGYTSGPPPDVSAGGFRYDPARMPAMMVSEKLSRLDAAVIHWMNDHGRRFLRLALAVIFIWFGALKLFAIGPADDLVRRTVYWVNPDSFLPLLGAWEMLIGLCFLLRPLLRLGLLLLLFQLPGTFLPLVLLPEVCFVQAPWVLTMEGQYIVKNLLIIGAALVIGGSMRTLGESPRGPGAHPAAGR
jgi:uncharacterized membrane protein YkgB